ncbi:MAG: hypothetical protein ACRDRI_14845 [Pseudonocardiaceae bacterium]
MRAIIVKESLEDGELPSSLRGSRVREYRHPLDEDTVITIIELVVAERHALDAGMALSRKLVSRLYYAHILNDQSMYIVFPNCLVYLDRDDADGERQAHAIGQTFDIPLSQMRFQEMFEIDHPDDPAMAGP